MIEVATTIIREVRKEPAVTVAFAILMAALIFLSTVGQS